VQPGGKRLTKKAKEKLETARKLFHQIDVDKSNYLNDDEVKQCSLKLGETIID
jgi:hypothetical protein